MASSEGSTASLSAWLKDIGLGNIEKSLNELQIFTTNDLAILLETDLQDVIVVSNLSMREKAIFKVSVRKLQNQRVVPKIELDLEGQKCASKLLELTKQARGAISLFENTISDVDANIKSSKKAVSVEFTEIRKKFEEREHQLLSEIELQGNEKIKQLKQQCTQTTNALNQLSEMKTKTERMMDIKSLDDLDKVQKTIKTELLGVYDVEFPTEPATNSDLRFESDRRMLESASHYGNVASYKRIEPPSIKKLEATASSVKVFWEHQCDPDTPRHTLPSAFEIKSTELLDDDKVDDNLVTEFETDAKAESFEIKDLKKDTTYKIEMRTKNKNGWSVYGKSQSIKTKPIDPATFFVGTTLLDADSKLKLIEFLGGSVKNVKLLFKTTVNGFKATDFHKYCDNKGPTVTVVKRNGSSTIYGGYTPLSWNSSNRWVKDDTFSSFVFTMKNDEGCPAKYKHKHDPQYAIYCASICGPVFGRPHALYIRNIANSSTDSLTRKCDAYGVPTATTLCGQEGDHTIDDYEVFAVTL